jgi:hypothetical protein
VDKAKPQNQIIYWHEQECSEDSDMDCSVRIFDTCLFQVPVKVDEEFAAIATLATA